jgi:hypothetical protein
MADYWPISINRDWRQDQSCMFLPSIYYQIDAARKGHQMPADAIRSVVNNFIEGLRKAAARI